MTTWMDAFDQGYEEGFEAGVEEAKEQFMQTQLLIFHTGGNA
jgi:flagellar biosynthesis/type III secretory pathway protein FliH